MKKTSVFFALSAILFACLFSSQAQASCKSGWDYDMAQAKARDDISSAFRRHSCSKEFTAEANRKLEKVRDHNLFSRGLKLCYESVLRAEYKRLGARCKSSRKETQDYVPEDDVTVES